MRYLILATALLSSITANARIGDTPEEDAKRYGKADIIHEVNTYSARTCKVIEYRTKSLCINPTYIDNKCVSTSFHKNNRTEWSESEVIKVIKTNFPESNLTGAIDKEKIIWSSHEKENGPKTLITKDFTLDLHETGKPSDTFFSSSLKIQTKDFEKLKSEVDESRKRYRAEISIGNEI